MRRRPRMQSALQRVRSSDRYKQCSQSLLCPAGGKNTAFEGGNLLGRVKGRFSKCATATLVGSKRAHRFNAISRAARLVHCLCRMKSVKCNTTTTTTTSIRTKEARKAMLSSAAITCDTARNWRHIERQSIGTYCLNSAPSMARSSNSSWLPCDKGEVATYATAPTRTAASLGSVTEAAPCSAGIGPCNGAAPQADPERSAALLDVEV
jgi:hypothetical protein